MKRLIVLILILLIAILGLIFVSAKSGNLTASILGVGEDSDFAGYTDSYTGGLGGVKGANEKCDNLYDGSHWCSLEEVIELGDDYPWTATVWIRDAVLSLPMLKP